MGSGFATAQVTVTVGPAVYHRKVGEGSLTRRLGMHLRMAIGLLTLVAAVSAVWALGADEALGKKKLPAGTTIEVRVTTPNTSCHQDPTGRVKVQFAWFAETASMGFSRAELQLVSMEGTPVFSESRENVRGALDLSAETEMQSGPYRLLLEMETSDSDVLMHEAGLTVEDRCSAVAGKRLYVGNLSWGTSGE
jgi:hypothetical protein